MPSCSFRLFLREKNERRFSFSAPFSADSRIIRSQRRAQANSVARMARPIGITTIAGPGRTIRAMPIRSTVPPTTETTTRRAYLSSIGRYYQDQSCQATGEAVDSAKKPEPGGNCFNFVHDAVHARDGGLERLRCRHVYPYPLQQLYRIIRPA